VSKCVIFESKREKKSETSKERKIVKGKNKKEESLSL